MRLSHLTEWKNLSKIDLGRLLPFLPTAALFPQVLGVVFFVSGGSSLPWKESRGKKFWMKGAYRYGRRQRKAVALLRSARRFLGPSCSASRSVLSP